MAILTGLKGADGGTAGLVVADDPGQALARTGPRRGQAARLPGGLPPGVMPAIGLVTAPDELSTALTGLLAGVVVASDLEQAREVLRADPELRVVTRDGDLLGAHWAHGGSASPPSTLAMRAAADEAAGELAAAERAAQAAAATLASAVADEERDRAAVSQALAGVRAADKAAAESSGQLGRLSGAARAAQEEAARLEAAVASVTKKRERALAEMDGLSAKLAEAENENDPGETSEPAAAQDADGPDRDSMAAQASAAREAETDARLEVRTAEERLRAIAGRADALAGAAARERRAAEAAVARRRLRAQQAEVAGAVAAGAETALARIGESLATAQADREAAEQMSKGRTEALKQVRARVRALAADLDRVVDTAHGAEVSRAEQRMRLEQIAARAAEEFGVDAAALVAEYGPDVPVPVPDEEEAAPVRGRGRPRAAQRGAEPAAQRGAEPAAPDTHQEELAAQDGAEWPQAGQNGQQSPQIRQNGQNGPQTAQNGQGSPQAVQDGLPEPQAAPVGLAAVSVGEEPQAVQGDGAAPQAVRGDGAAPQAVRGDGAAPQAAGNGKVSAPAVRTVPYVRAEQEKRAATAQRQLDQLGKVNPLALEEYAALEERHAFLANQLEDLKKTRRDLLTVVKEVDDRVQEVFASPACFPAARAGWSSPNPTTCWPPASTSKPGHRARRSSGSRCCQAGSGR